MILRQLTLASALAAIVLTSACGGGGSGAGYQPSPTPTQPTDPGPDPDPDPEPEPEPDPEPEPPPTPGPNDPRPRYTGVSDNILVMTNADLAHDQGHTGAGVKIGLLDDMQYDYDPLDGKVAFYGDYTDEPGEPDSEEHGKRGHGAVIGGAMVGRPGADFAGGIAPDAELYWGRICVNDGCWSDAAGRAAEEMTQMGVGIFNLSLGGTYENEEDAVFSTRAWKAAMDTVIQTNGLVIVSTGNSAHETSGYPAAAPFHAPELIDNWLAVTAVDVANDGSIAGHSGYANQCGDAADWCISAPGRTLQPAVPGTNYEYGAVGTSMSAGLVSGVAALVSGAYPWMTGDNIQKTLLTTAIDLGEAGVDRTYGWGLVDANRAVRGPGQFIHDFNANVDSGRYIFSNDIHGEGGLIKEGGGTLILAGDNSFAGETVVRDGRLGFAGDTASNVSVTDGGTYAAMGGVLGGDYTALEGATTQVAIGQPLQVAGDALLDGTLDLLKPDAGYTAGGRETVLTAGSVDGTFADTTYGNGFFWTAELDYTDTGVFADLTRTSAAASAMSVGAAAAVVDGAGQMDGLVQVLDEAVQSGAGQGKSQILSDAARIMHADRADTALASLTGQIHGTARTVGLTGAINSSRLHADRLPRLANTTTRTAWIGGTRIEGDLERPGYAQASYRHDETVLGIDMPLGRSTVGASISRARIDADINGHRDTFDSHATTVTAYGFKPMGSWYAAGQLGYTAAEIDTRRDVIVGEQAVELLSSRDASVWQARVEAGYRLASGLSPFAAVGSIRYEPDGFSERGDTALGLAAGSDSQSVSYLDLGLRHQHRISGGWTFQGVLAYRNMFSGRDTSFRAWFSGEPEADFTVNGQPIGSDAVRAMLGIAFAPGQRVTYLGNVGAERVSGQQENVSAQLEVRLAF